MQTIPADVLDAARASQKAYGIPASISIAQWAVESAWGARMSGRCNPFGMKAMPGQASQLVTTHEYYKGHRIEVRCAFRAFDTLEAAFEAHAKMLATRPAYARARAKLPDVFAFANALTGVYATDPQYGRTLGSVIRSNNLTRFDA